MVRSRNEKTYLSLQFSDFNSLLNACLLMEFYYINLFCFAPAAQAIQVGSRALPQERLQALSEFEDQATQAGHALLSIVVDFLKPSGLIKYLPVRCWLFIVAASLHLLKVHCTFQAEPYPHRCLTGIIH
jgi:hypothetical protein